MNKAREHARRLIDYLNETTLALPPRRNLDTIASEVAALHQAEGGATYHPRFGDIAGQRLWAIAPYIERTQILPGKRISRTRIKQFARANADILAAKQTNQIAIYDLEVRQEIEAGGTGKPRMEDSENED